MNLLKKIEGVPLSNDTVKKRIQSMSCDIKDQVIEAIKRSRQFSLQLDESTDISDDAQLLTYVRYQGLAEMEEEFLFCKPLQTTGWGRKTSHISKFYSGSIVALSYSAEANFHSL